MTDSIEGGNLATHFANRLQGIALAAARHCEAEVCMQNVHDLHKYRLQNQFQHTANEWEQLFETMCEATRMARPR